MKVLIDTCVIIDGLEKREPFWKEAQAIFRMAASKEAQFFLTTGSVMDLFYIEHKRSKDAPLTKDILFRLLKLFLIADTTSANCRNALLYETADYEDAVIMETAARENMDCIVTRNVRHFKKSRVPVMTPKEFLKKAGAGN